MRKRTNKGFLELSAFHLKEYERYLVLRVSLSTGVSPSSHLDQWNHLHEESII